MDIQNLISALQQKAEQDAKPVPFTFSGNCSIFRRERQKDGSHFLSIQMAGVQNIDWTLNNADASLAKVATKDVDKKGRTFLRANVTVEGDVLNGKLRAKSITWAAFHREELDPELDKLFD